jgi:hypothetical protein
VPQDTAMNDSSEETIISLPLSEAEIEDLLYGGERSSAERIELLRALRDDIAERESSDFGDSDPRALVDEIDSRIAELLGAERDGSKQGMLDRDPLAHRETLAPDSDELNALEEDDEASLGEEPDLFGDGADEEGEALQPSLGSDEDEDEADDAVDGPPGPET